MSELSIIIPVYNAETTLENTVRSIDCAEKSIEILLIDDASTDKSAALCRRLAAADERIRCLLQPKNKGVSAARNSGLAKAHGTWVLFADADDRFMPGAIKKILQYAKHLSADLLCFNCLIENRRLIPARPIVPQHFGVPRSAAVRLCEDLYGLQSKRFCGEGFRAVWGKLFRRDKLLQSGAKFPENMGIGEDAVFLMQFFESAPKTEFINACWYVYRTEAPSAVRSVKKDITAIQMPEYRALLMEKPRLYGTDWDTILYSFLLQCAESFAANEYLRGSGAAQIYRRTLDYLQSRPMYTPHSFHAERLRAPQRIRARFLQFHFFQAEAAACTLFALKRAVKQRQKRKKS